MSEIQAMANAGAEGARASKAGIDLIDKIIGPMLTRRQATADAQAEILGALANLLADYIESSPFDRNMLEVLAACGGKASVVNLANILSKTSPMIDESAVPSLVSDDWVANWRDKARISSDEQMQNTWARILAGEVTSPGSFSRKTVNIMADLDKGDAELFVSLCNFAWHIDGQAMPLVYDLLDGMYAGDGIHFDGCSRLESLGLIQFNGVTGFWQRVRANTSISYGEQSIMLPTPETSGRLNVGFVLFTQAGRELFSICEVEPVDGFFDYVQYRIEYNSEAEPDERIWVPN
jgi:hypothetical protein